MIQTWRRALLSVALIAALASEIAFAGDTDTHGIREAKSLFSVVKSRMEIKQERCSISSDWLDYPVPEKIAHSQFGLTIHAALAPTFPRDTPAATIGFGGNNSFCSRQEAEAFRAESLLAFGSSNEKSLNSVLQNTASPSSIQIIVRQ